MGRFARWLGLESSGSTQMNGSAPNGHAPDFALEVPSELTGLMTGEGVVAPRIPRSHALQVPAVLRSRNLIAGTLARLPIHVRDKTREMVDPTGMLEQVDPDVPNVVTFASTYEDLLFEGIAWWKVVEFGWRGYPRHAIHVSPDRVHVAGTGVGDVPPVAGQSLFPVNGTVFIDGYPVEDREVIRFDSPNPPLLKHAARAIRTCLRLDRTAAMYADEPLPLGYFSPRDGMSAVEDQETIQKILDAWEEARRTRAWGYVGKALEAKVLQFDAEQIQLADQRQHAVLEIARAAGVDPEDLGVSTTTRTYQNAEQRRQDLLDFTLMTYMTAVEQRLSMRDVLPRGYEAKVALDGFLRSDTKTRMQAYRLGKSVGAYTEDEIRELEDRPPLPPGSEVSLNPEPSVEELI